MGILVAIAFFSLCANQNTFQCFVRLCCIQRSYRGHDQTFVGIAATFETIIKRTFIQRMCNAVLDILANIELKLAIPLLTETSSKDHIPHPVKMVMYHEIQYNCS